MTTRITAENITDATITTTDLAASVPLNTQWQAVVTASTLNAAVGKGYFIDTTSNACTITITASGSATAGDTIVFKDYARNWGTNAVTFASNKFDGVDSRTPSFNTNGQTVTLVHMGATKGWSIINEDTTTSLGATYTAATGGTVTTSGDFKIHSFTGDSNFVVSSVGNTAGSGTKVSYIVVAGGGGGGGTSEGGGGGGGAGGFREGKVSSDPYTDSPLDAGDGLTVSAQTYPVTVGAGGTGGHSEDRNPPGTDSTSGSNSIFSTITSTGGGSGGQGDHPYPGTTVVAAAGGSGGGGVGGAPGASPASSGNGNTPPVSPPQGTNGGNGKLCGSNSQGQNGGGGGGATVAGTEGTTFPGSGSAPGGPGGTGATTSITGSPVAYAGGGGGGRRGTSPNGNAGTGGTGGGGAGTVGDSPTPGVAGTANSGGGGGGGGRGEQNPSTPTGGCGGAGGKGVVIIRYKFQN